MTARTTVGRCCSHSGSSLAALSYAFRLASPRLCPNSADIRLVIEAMDLLRVGHAELPDRQFGCRFRASGDPHPKTGTSRLRYGSIGAAVTFRGSCTSYIFIENLHPDAPANNPATAMKPLRPRAALEDSNGQEGWVMHEDLSRSLARQHVDFDTRTYVFRSVRDLLC